MTFSTVAGNANQSAADGQGTSARLNNPWGVAVDSSGNLYVADTDDHIIRKVTSGGAVSTLAGLAGVSGTNDGTGTNARFFQPQGIAVDTSGNLYVSDTGNFTVRKITPAGTVSTLAGSAGLSGTNDNTGSSARFYEPEGIGINSSGTMLYVADTWNHSIRQITLPGAVVSTLAGTPGSAGSGNGTGSGAQFNEPQGIAVDNLGNIYVGDTGNQMVRLVTAGGAVSTLAGSADVPGSADGTGTGAFFWDPEGVATDNTNIFVADTFNQTIRKVAPGGVVSTIAGAAGKVGSADGTGGAARFWQAQGVAADAFGNVYVADSANGTIRVIAPGAVVTTLAGSPSIGSADGPGTTARFNGPAGAAVDSSGNNYVADSQNDTIRVISPAGAVSTLAGLAGASGTNDATGSSARFNGLQGLAIDSSANLYVGDTANHTVRKVTSAGAVTTIAGAAGANGVTDGTGSAARFNFPQGVAADNSGNFYVADTWNHIIRKVTSAGVVTTFAGFPGLYGDSDGTGSNVGTNGARFYCPSGLVVDGSGNVFVADTRNHTVRKITSSGVVSTLAGLPGSYGSADGTNNAARFFLPTAITIDLSGNLYVLDSGNDAVRMITTSGTNYAVTTVAGLPDVSGSADGTGSNARFFCPAGLGLNASGSFCVADWGNNTIRAGISSSNSSPSILTQPQPQTVNQGSNATFSVKAAGLPPLSYHWRFNTTNIAGATGTNYSIASAYATNAGSYTVVVTNSQGSVTSVVATLTVNLPPSITSQPQSQTLLTGSCTTFSVGAAGTSPLYYQWQFDGAPQGAFTTSATSPTECTAGTYSVIVSNFVGFVSSTNVMLTFTNPPTAAPGHFDGVSLLGDGSLLLRMGGTAYTNYTLQFTTDWMHWIPLATLSGTNGVFQYDDPSPRTNASRFYRLEMGP